MRFPIAAVCAAALVLAPAAAEAAGALTIAPINVTLIGKERTSTVQVRNAGAEAISVQIRTVDWTQADSKDVYSPSKSLIASPPFFTLQPNQAQVVRLVVDAAKAPATEQAWRLIVDQLAPPKSEGGSGVSVPIRALVPVFLAPSTSARPKLSWTAAKAPQGVKLTVSNNGPVHDRITGLTLASPGASAPAQEPLFGYVLSGASRTWTASGPAGGALTVSGDGAFGPVKADLRVTD